jgi:ketol-acid reductoisomerase
MTTKGKAKKRVAIIGYGSQGRAFALNLKDSGHEVLVGLRLGSKSRRLASRDGIKSIDSIASATAKADTVCFAFPDHLHGKIFESQIAPSLRPGATLLFLHGMSVHFGLVKPPSDCDVLLLAPHAPGVAVREKYLTDRSISAFFAVHQNRSRRGERTLVELAEGVGFAKRRLVKTTFRDEAVGDLFGEQAVLCGGLAMLIKTGHELLVERGIKPENAFLEVVYQLDLIVALIKKHGVAGMLNRISVAARYGSVRNGPRIIDSQTRQRMRKVLQEIESGQFVRSLAALTPSEARKLGKATLRLSNRNLENAARKYAR